ncbi:MAG: SCO family protein [Gemmatimonadota bacterium]
MSHRLIFRTFQILTGLLLGLAVVFWFVRPREESPDAASASYFLPEPMEAPTFDLLSHTGHRVSAEDFPGKLLAVFFGYTSCPDVCPLTLSDLERAFRELGEDARRVQVLFITVDPARDSPERMATYLGAFHPSFLGLTGSEEEIREVADAFGVFFNRNDEGENYTVDHTARTFILDPSGRIPLSFPVTATPEEMARDLAILLRDLE